MTSAITLHTVRLAALLMLGVGAGPASAVVYTVGADAACTHANVQSAFWAIPAGDHHVVRIANTWSTTRTPWPWVASTSP